VNDPNNPGEACFFSDKIRAGEEAGYDVVLVANHHAGAQGGETPLRLRLRQPGSPVLGTAAGLRIGHESCMRSSGGRRTTRCPTR
jgi:alkanesulfonate monooxygenase SsuD/methylene tetrahydromethanopterin reductase-like flavin-dependent oxidoreductase (luciferase family)